MERLMLSDKQDYWYLSNEKSGFVLRLLLRTEPVSKSSCVEAALDNKGNPHLIIKNELQYQYLFWNGSKWDTKKILITHNPVSFCINAHDKHGIYIVYTAEDGMIYGNRSSSNTWQENRLYLTAAKVEKAVLLNRNEPYLLVLMYCYSSPNGKRLAIAFNNDLKWEAAKEIEIKKAELINWLVHDAVLFVLLSDESFENTAFQILRIDLNNFDVQIERELLSAVRWEGQPSLIISMDMDLKILWQYKGNIFFANIDRLSLKVKETVKTSLFYPAEIIPYIGVSQAVDSLAFRKLNGVYLKSPLLLTDREFESLLKEKNKS